MIFWWFHRIIIPTPFLPHQLSVFAFVGCFADVLKSRQAGLGVPVRSVISDASGSGPGVADTNV